jgi:hypothetical protein
LLPCPGIWRVSFDELHLKNSQLLRAVHHLGVANWEVSEEMYKLLLGLRKQRGVSSKLLGNVHEYLVGLSVKFGFSGLTKK